MSKYKEIHIIMVGPSLDAKGGVSSFARYYMAAGLPDKFKTIYSATTIDAGRIQKSLFFIKGAASFIAMLIFDRNIKIAHILSASNSSFYRKSVILLIARIFRKKSVFHIHGSGFDLFYNKSRGLKRLYIRKILDIADLIVVLSGAWFSAVTKMTGNKNVKIIPNSIDTSDFKLIKSRKEDIAGLNILTVGRLEARKGTYDILKAVKPVIKEFPEAQFYLAGDGEIEKVEEICRKENIEKNVHVTKWLDRNELISALSRASIFLLPSYHEGLPIAVLEAMASGLPVVSTGVGGIPEAVEDGINGFLVAPGDIQAISSRIITLLRDKGLRDRMGKAGAGKIDTVFSAGRAMDRFYKEYEGLLASSSKAACAAMPYAGLGRLCWYINRLSCMPLEEVFYRMYKSMLLNSKRLIKTDIRLQSVICKDNIRSNFYFDNSELEKIKKEFSELFPGRIEGIVREADELCRHRFKIFNLDYNSKNDIDWHMDIVTGKRWPLKFWMDMDFKADDQYGEVRFVWELNRHQHLVTLGKAYCLSRDEKYAGEIVSELLSWIKRNPPYTGVNWASSLEIGLRLISWCWAYEFISASESFSENFRLGFLKSVYQQADFVINNLSRHSSANNHLIGEACGLIMAALTFPEFKKSKSWLESGKKILFKEIKKQVYGDGVSKEQAFHYQGFVMQLLLLACVLLEKNRIAVPQEVRETYFNMCEFVMNIMDMNHNVPNAGDSDSGMAIRLAGTGNPDMFCSLLTSGAMLSSRQDFKEKGNGFREENYWLFGMDGFEKYKKIPGEKTRLVSRLFSEGGYAILRNNSNHNAEKVLLMDCGELGYGSMAAHGHADLTSITLSAYGEELLIDPGTYSYHRNRAWRDYFRGTTAHNTIAINRKNQSEMKGPFMWGRRPAPNLEAWESSSSKDYIKVSFRTPDGFHRRSVYYDKMRDAWLVRDYIEVDRESMIEQFFHLKKGSAIKKADGNVIEIKTGKAFLYIAADKRFSVSIKEGLESPITGWSSTVFGAKDKAPVIVSEAVMQGESTFDTFLYVSDTEVGILELKDVFEVFENAK